MSDMFEKDKNVIAYALNMWANYIETHDVSMSQYEAISQGKSELALPLVVEQQKFVVRLRDLSAKYMLGEVSGDV